MTKRPYAIGYVRVSTEEQAVSGLGLEGQRVSVTATAAQLGLEVRAIVEDAGLSGSLALADRPALLKAVMALPRGGVLLVAKRDRLGRDHLEVGLVERSLKQRGARLISAAGEGGDDDEPGNWMLRRQIDLFAEYERRIGIGRTKTALAVKRARGERAGQIPFGFMLEAGSTTRLTPAPVEQRLIARVHELATLGYSLRQTAADLNAHGWTTRNHTPWRFQYIARLLKVSA